MPGEIFSPGFSENKMKTKYTNENFVIAANMVDEDNGKPCCEAFAANASLSEGIAGRKSIDTLFENTSQDIVESPRSMSTSPAGLPDLDQYPHRRL